MPRKPRIEFAGAESRHEITGEELRSPSRTPGLARARGIFTQVAHALDYRGPEIARFLQKDPAAVTRYLHQGAYAKEARNMLGELER